AVKLPVARPVDGEAMRFPVYDELGHADLERRPSEVEESSRLHVADATAHNEHRDVDVRRVLAANRDFDCRLLVVDIDNVRLTDAFALGRHERGGLAKRHAHLKPRRLAGLVRTLLRNELDAIACMAFETRVFLADPDFRMRG